MYHKTDNMAIKNFLNIKVWNKFIFQFCLIGSFGFANAQITNVNVSINILPPYSTYITDYINNQNKTIITLIPNGLSTTDQATVYFKASIVGDNGVSIITKTGYKPPQGLLLTGSFPKILSGKNLSEYFDVNNMIFTGITFRELVNGNGLPEGNYTICIQVFDFNTDLPLSQMPPMGCSAPLNIQHVDPPLPLSPQCGGSVFISRVQNMLFNWSYNPGVTPNVQYLLKIVPVLPTQNPNDAINTMVTPAFFEKIVKSTSYLYGPADPQLVKGQKYAYRIKAFDPLNKVIFKNNGESEVCSFIYGEKDTTPVIKPNLDPTIVKLEIENPICGKSPINDNQFYVKWKAENISQKSDRKSSSFGNKSQYLIEIREAGVNNKAEYRNLKIIYSAYTDKLFYQEKVALLKLTDKKSYLFKVYRLENNIIKAESESCLFIYRFEAPKPEPREKDLIVSGQILYTAKGREGDFLLYKTPISIKEIYYLANKDNIDVPIFKFSNNPISKKANQIYYRTTDINGFFTGVAPFEKIGIVSENYKSVSGMTGVLVHALSIEINSPYYTNIEKLFYASNDNKLDFGKLYTKVFTFNLTVNVKKGYKDATGVQSNFENCNVMLYKQKTPYTGMPIFKKNLGYDLEKEYATGDYVYVNNQFTQKASNKFGTSSTQVVFENLVCTENPNHHYLITLENNGFDKGIQVVYSPNTKDQLNPYNHKTSVNATFISNLLPKSKVKGQIFYSYKGSTTASPLNATLLLKVCYITIVNGKKIVMNSFNADKIGQNQNNTDAIMTKFNAAYPDNGKSVGWTNSNSNGEFEFNIENADIYDDTKNPFSAVQSGEFGWNFSGDIYRCLRVVVNNGYYTNPDEDIFIEPLQTVNVGKLTAQVRSIRVVVNCTAGDFSGQTIVKGNGIPGLSVGLKRQKEVPNYFPKNEGNIYKANNVPDQFNNGKYISYGETNFLGSVTFNDIVITNNEDFGKLLIKANSPELKGDFSYWGQIEKKVSYYDFYGDYTFYDKAVFNSDYNVPTLTINMILIPTLPQVKGRVMDVSKSNTGLEGALATLEYKTLFGAKKKQYDITDENGYFEFKSLDLFKSSNGTVDGPNRKLIVDKAGYYYSQTQVIWKKVNLPFEKEIGILKMGSQVVIPEIYLTPSASLTGFVKDESGKDVNCYVSVLGGELKQTESKANGMKNGMVVFDEEYNILLPPGKDVKIVVWPKDLKYFIDTITIPEIKVGQNTFNLMVYKRLHRFSVLVTEKSIFKFKGKSVEVNKTIENAVVEIEGNFATTNKIGVAELSFANTSTKNFTIKINGPVGSDYIQQQIKVTNYETKSQKTSTFVVLENGVNLSGYITVNGQPLSGVKVLIERGAGQKPNETLCDEKGYYNLKGINLESDKTALIKVVSGNLNGKVIVGIEDKINFSKGSVQKDFALITFNDFDVSQFNGFKLEITKLRLTGKEEVEISGFVNLENQSNAFSVAENGKISFKNFKFKKGTKKNSNGLIEGIPLSDELKINNASINLKYGQHINVVLTEPLVNNGQTYSFKSLAFRKTDVNTNLSGLVYIVDNSFDFPGSYLSFGKSYFFFRENTNNLIVQVFKNNSKTNKTDEFYLSNNKGTDIKFKFLQFDASAKTETSKITLLNNGEPKLSLDTKITAHFDNMTPSDLEIDLGVFEMNHEKIFPLSGKQNIKFGLEKWTVEVKNWQITSDKGGIVATEGFVNTGIVNVPFKYFHMQNNLLKFEKFTLSDIKIGNVSQLEIGVGTTPIFGFDKATGTDKKPHWKMTLVGNKNNPAAKFGGMEGLQSGKKINIEVLSIISNGENLLSFGATNEPLILYDIVKFTPSTITSYSDYYTMGGILDLGIPKISSNLTGNIIVKGSNGGKIDILPQQFEFEGKGFVRFISKGTNQEIQTIKKNELTLIGTIEEPGKTPLFKCELVKKSVNGESYINLIPNQTVQFGTKKLTKVTGIMQTKSKIWDYFTFEGDLEGFEGVDDKQKHLKFTVYGDIKAEGQAIKCDNINTPFGGMEITYDFDKSELRGHMDINMDFSESLSVQGVANMVFGNKGFYIAAAAQITAPVINTFNAGILVGTYSGGLPSQVLSDVVKYNYNKNVPCYLANNGLGGFFITGARELPLKVTPFSIDIPPGLALVSVSAGATSGAEVQLAMDFKGGFKLNANILVYAHAWTGIAAITCTEAKADVVAELLVAGSYENGQFSIDGCGSLVLDVKGSQKIPILVGCTTPEISLNTTLGAKYTIHIGSDGFSQSVSFSLGSGASNCTTILNCK